MKNQMRSQKHPAPPEGYLWLKSELHKNAWDFRYDIARGECAMPFFDSWWPGKINCTGVLSHQLYSNRRTVPTI